MEGFFSQMNQVIISVYEKIGRVETLMNEQTEMDLTINEIHILEKINERSGINIRDLASILGVTTATVTVAIQKLEKKGFVLKEKSRSDLRGVVLSLTREGTKVVRLHNMFHIRMVRSMTSGLSEDEVRTLHDSLQKLNGHLEGFLDDHSQ